MSEAKRFSAACGFVSMALTLVCVAPRPPACFGVELQPVLESHAASGESLQGDRNPQEAGPSQRRQTGGGRSDDSVFLFKDNQILGFTLKEPDCWIKVVLMDHSR